MAKDIWWSLEAVIVTQLLGIAQICLTKCRCKAGPCCRWNWQHLGQFRCAWHWRRRSASHRILEMDWPLSPFRRCHPWAASHSLPWHREPVAGHGWWTTTKRQGTDDHRCLANFGPCLLIFCWSLAHVCYRSTYFKCNQFIFITRYYSHYCWMIAGRFHGDHIATGLCLGCGSLYSSCSHGRYFGWSGTSRSAMQREVGLGMLGMLGRSCFGLFLPILAYSHFHVGLMWDCETPLEAGGSRWKLRPWNTSCHDQMQALQSNSYTHIMLLWHKLLPCEKLTIPTIPRSTPHPDRDLIKHGLSETVEDCRSPEEGDLATTTDVKWLIKAESKHIEAAGSVSFSRLLWNLVTVYKSKAGHNAPCPQGARCMARPVWHLSRPSLSSMVGGKQVSCIILPLLGGNICSAHFRQPWNNVHNCAANSTTCARGH